MTSLDVKVAKNTHVKLEFHVKNNIGSPVNLTDYQVKWQIKKSVGSLPLITKTTLDDSIEIIDAVKGRFQVKIYPEDTIDLPATEYYHEALLTTAGGEFVTLTNGEFVAGIFLLRDQYTTP